MKTPSQRLEEMTPILAWIVVTTSSVYYHFFNDKYLRIYDFLSNAFGAGIIWMPMLVGAAWKRGFNAYSKACLVGIIAYDVVNLAYQGFKSYTGNTQTDDPAAVLYSGIFELTGVVFATALSALFLIRNRSAGVDQ